MPSQREPKPTIAKKCRTANANKGKSLKTSKTRCKTNVAPVDNSSDIPSEITNERLDTGNSQSNSLIFPVITRNKLKKVERSVTGKDIDPIVQKLDRCLWRLNDSDANEFHFFRLHFVRATIVDALLNRKWNNLLKLVIKLSRNYMDPVFKLFIRNLCQILKHYHPSFRGTAAGQQLDLILEKHEANRLKRNNITNIV